MVLESSALLFLPLAQLFGLDPEKSVYRGVFMELGVTSGLWHLDHQTIDNPKSRSESCPVTWKA
jgi:hypothetical protein